MAKSARVVFAEADVDDEAKVSAEEGEGIGRDRGPRADKADRIVDAASADSGLPIEEKAVGSELICTEPVDVSVINGNVATGNPNDESVLAEKVEVEVWICGEKKANAIDSASEGNLNVLVGGVVDDGVEAAADTDEADGFEERKEDVEGMIEAKGTRPALQNCRNTEKTATR